MQHLIRLIITAVSIWVATLLVQGITIASPPENGNVSKVLVLLVVAVVFTLVNAVVKPIVKLLSLPLVIVTLGLFLLVINALMLGLTAWITSFSDYGLRVDGVWAAVIGGIIVGVVNWVLGILVPDND